MEKPFKKERNLLIILIGLIILMLGLAFASVPLYRIFCQKTGFGGTTQQSAVLPKVILNREITIRFNADVNKNLPWIFQPLQREIKVKVGEQGLAFYRVKNLSNHPLIGMATYNVTPDKAGPYFTKVECFCFIEQRLEPGEDVEMPVTFFVDPAINEDPTLKDVKTITLSYTFFEYKGIENFLPTIPSQIQKTHLFSSTNDIKKTKINEKEGRNS